MMNIVEIHVGKYVLILRIFNGFFFRPLIYLLAPSKYYYLHIRKQQYTKFAEFEDTFTI